MNIDKLNKFARDRTLNQTDQADKMGCCRRFPELGAPLLKRFLVRPQ